MSGPPSRRDWELLGVAPGASPDQVRSGYHRQRELWGEGSLATYSLLDEGERATLLAELDAAWQRVRASFEVPPPPTGSDRASSTGEPPPPGDAGGPGASLRSHRLQRGISLEEVAAVTKIHPATLAKLEREELHALPPRVYVRGFVIQFARVVGVEDPEGLATRFLARMG